MPAHLQALRESFFNTLFSLLGHMANCDGYINRNEIRRSQIYMEKMNLSEKCKREAQQLFREGSNPDFNIKQLLKDFRKTTTPNLIQILLVYLISMARTDGLLVKKEMQLVRKLASELGYSSIVFDHLLRMISAQDELTNPSSAFESQSASQTFSYQQKSSEERMENSSFSELDLAYQALGVNRNMSAEEIKKHYQKLLSQYHPDKLVGQGMPTDLVNIATERFKKIQSAYETIRKYWLLTAVA